MGWMWTVVVVRWGQPFKIGMYALVVVRRGDEGSCCGVRTGSSPDVWDVGRAVRGEKLLRGKNRLEP